VIEKFQENARRPAVRRVLALRQDGRPGAQERMFCHVARQLRVWAQDRWPADWLTSS